MELNRSYKTGWGSGLRTVRQTQDRADLAAMSPRLASVAATTVRTPATPTQIETTAAGHWNLPARLDLNISATKYVRRSRFGPRRYADRSRVTFPHAGPREPP
jgi:hypothetical protein